MHHNNHNHNHNHNHYHPTLAAALLSLMNALSSRESTSGFLMHFKRQKQ